MTSTLLRSLLLSLLGLLLLNGCQTKIELNTEGGSSFKVGVFEGTLAAGLETSQWATEKVLKSYKFSLTEQKSDALVALFKARTAEDKTIVVKLRAENPKLTKVDIRIGTFGDQKLSQEMLGRIRAEL